jgi:hypothetical protein
MLRLRFHPEGMLGLGQALYYVGKSPMQSSNDKKILASNFSARAARLFAQKIASLDSS